MPARRTCDSVRGRVLAASHDQTGTVAHLARVKYPALGEGSLSWANVLSLDAGVGCSFSAGAAVALSDNEERSLYGAPWLQPVATGRKSLARENGSIKPRPLPPAATSCRLKRMVRNAMKKGLPSDRLQLVDWELSRGGPFRCCTPVWISAASVSTSICLTVRERRSRLVPRHRTPTVCSG